MDIDNLKLIAGVSCEHFLSIHARINDGKNAEQILKGDIPFRKIYVKMDEATAPGNINEGQFSAWLYEYHSLAWCDILRRMFLKTQNSIYKEKQIEYTLAWFDQYGTPSDPLPTAKNPGDFSWYDMSVAFRVDVLIGLLSILDGESCLFTKIKEHLCTHQQILLDDEFYAKIGNHAMHQNNALLSAGLFFNDKKNIEIAIDRFRNLLASSIDEEGVSKEGSPAYHAFNLFWWKQSIRRLEIARQLYGYDVPEVPDMRNFLAHCIAPDGQYVPIGDSMLLNIPLAKDYFYRFGSEHLDYLQQDKHLAFALTGGEKGERPESSLAVFKEGYCFSRNNNGKTPAQDSHCSIRFGAGLATRVHAHDDGGSITYYPNGIRLIEDGGMYGYYGGSKREFAKSMFAHNSIMSFSAKYYRSAVNELSEYQTDREADFLALKIVSLQDTKLTRKFFHHKLEHFLFVEDIYSSQDDFLFQNWNLGQSFSIVNVLRDRIDVEGGGLRASFFWLCKNVTLEIRTGCQNPMLGWASKAEGDFHKIHSIQASVNAEIGKIPVVIFPFGCETDFEEISVESIKLSSHSTSFTINRKDDIFHVTVPPQK